LLTDAEKACNRAAAAVPQTLEIGGRSFLIPPLKLADFYAQRSKARELCMSTAEDPIEVVNKRVQAAEKAGKPLSPTIVKHLTEAALSAASSQQAKVEPTEDQIMQRTTTPDFLRWWVWHLCRKADKEITQAEVNELIGPKDEDAFELSNRIGEIMAVSLAGLNPN
jgi:hypothetical protein